MSKNKIFCGIIGLLSGAIVGVVLSFSTLLLVVLLTWEWSMLHPLEWFYGLLRVFTALFAILGIIIALSGDDEIPNTPTKGNEND